MPYTDQQINTGSFVPTSNIWDVQQIASVDVRSPEFKELLVRLYQNLSLMANVLNSKDSGFYLREQFLTGQAWFNPLSTEPQKLRGSFRKVIDIGTVGAGVITVAHGLALTTDWKFTYINGAVTNTATLIGYPLPFVGAAGYIELRIDATNVIVNNTTGVTFDYGYVVLEFLKS